MGLKDCSIYFTDQEGKKRHVLSAPTIEEAEKAFSMLCEVVPQYKNKMIEWQYTYFDDELAIGELR